MPLNTGETILVKREATYSLQGAAGNPLDITYRPSRTEAIEFTWNGKKYRYQGDARLMLIAIGPNRKPSLVAKAADNSWDAVHNYACTLPYYVQLIPGPDGRTWTWPPHIESWLYGQPKNLMLTRKPPGRMFRSYSASGIKQMDADAVAGHEHIQKVDRTYIGDICETQRRN